MAKINTPISIGAMEICRDKIVEILIDELPSQAGLLARPEINAKVFRERYKPIGYEEMPCVNSYVARSDSGKLAAVSSEGTYSFWIDVYTIARSGEGGAEVHGDEYSSIKNQELARVITGILHSTIYRKLDLPSGIVSSVTVTSYTPNDPENTKDSENTTLGRLQVDVKAVDGNITSSTIEALKAATAAKINNSDKGYSWIWEK